MSTKIRVLSFGGGVQSTALVVMAVNGDLPRPDLVMFADTGDESRSTYEHIQRVAKLLCEAGIEFVRVAAGNIRGDVLAASKPENKIGTGKVGQPPFFIGGGEQTVGQLWRKCSTEYKIEPMTQYLRNRLGVAKGKRLPAGAVEKWLGISLDEASRMKPSRHKWEVVKWPLIDKGMTRWDCHIYLKRHGWGVVPKSACQICPYHDNTYWREMRDGDPEAFRGVVEFERELHKGRIPGTFNPAYLHRSCIPLDEVDLSTDEDRGQYALNLWAGECEGICGT